VDDGVCTTFGNILLPHSVPGFSPAAAVHGGFSFGGLTPSNPVSPILIIFITVKNYFQPKKASKVDDGVCTPFGNLLLPHSVPGFSPVAAVHGGFSFGGLNPSNPVFSILIIFITVKNYFRQKK
jgi:hypothetical protein